MLLCAALIASVRGNSGKITEEKGAAAVIGLNLAQPRGPSLAALATPSSAISIASHALAVWRRAPLGKPASTWSKDGGSSGMFVGASNPAEAKIFSETPDRTWTCSKDA